MYRIHMGIPEMKEYWESLQNKIKTGKASKSEEKQYKQIGKALSLLSKDPKYPRLQSHEIDALTARYGMKVWESYLENHTPKAGRIFWVYGPKRGDITVIGIEPHPDDKSNAYKKITLSKTGDEVH
ncbi:MAG: hypothetical protein Q4D15_08895 [Lachnospiraceae bacterium]|nr:hypothetical protein [Lachnospiraceae bacterium]